MKTNISGFTIVRNGIKYDYPFIESIKSILPIVDEMIIAVGQSDDGTKQTLKKIKSPKIKIFDSKWDDSNRERGSEFARQTNIALEKCSGEWAFYLQADELLHENDLEKILSITKTANDSIDVISFKYVHFEANYNYYNPFRYKRAVRLVRNNRGIISIKDAAEFGHSENKKLKVKNSDIYIYHYGWVKSPKIMLEKFKNFEKYWHDEKYIKEKYSDVKEFDFKMLEVSKPFKGSHPEVMKDRVTNNNLTIPRKAPKRPLLLRKLTWYILLRKWGIIKGDWFQG